VIEPRLGKWNGMGGEEAAVELARAALTPAENKGLRHAGLALLAIIGLYFAFTQMPAYAPLVSAAGEGAARYQPLFAALTAGFFLVFLVTGIAFGKATGAIKSSRDVIDMMQEGLRSLAPYLVFVFFAAHFVAMFNWSRLGPILAINGAEMLAALKLPAPVLLVSVQMFGSVLDLVIGSASAKWSAMAPVVVPMFMLLGISPEMTTAAYRMGDSYTNIMTPLMSYFPMILLFARRWDPDYGVGSLLALMLPYALTFMVIGSAMVVGWVAFDLPLGPGAQVFYARPGGG
jgi:aminobenzoyl-glutamate transport protein